MNHLNIRQAVKTCEAGGVLAYPTEAVFGLGCLPLYEHAVRRILDLKQRSVSKGLILVAADIAQLHPYVDFGKVKDMDEIHQSWPGPVTWLIPAREETPDWLTGDHTTLAVRVSAHPLVRTLCEELGPLVSTSANPQGKPPARTSMKVRTYFSGQIDYIMPAVLSGTGNPSTIRDAMTGKIVRAG